MLGEEKRKKEKKNEIIILLKYWLNESKIIKQRRRILVGNKTGNRAVMLPPFRFQCWDFNCNPSYINTV